MDSDLNHGERVTISDCGDALAAIDLAIIERRREKEMTQKKIDALLTQRALIRQLVKLL